MGWGSASAYFYPVADALLEAGADDETRYKVCKALIRSLQDGDWDTEGEALGDYSEDEAIVRAFRECGVIVSCAAESENDQWCEEELRHSGPHRDWKGDEWA